MKSIDVINCPHRIDINISPNEGDIAIVSIDSQGSTGRLNLYVLEEYGYTTEFMPDQNMLSYGFGSATATDKKPILFVVTVSNVDTRINLEKNLFAALSEFRGWFRGKKLWLPLMGTGDGGLSIEESYQITVRAINKFIASYGDDGGYFMCISLPPKNEEAIELLASIHIKQPALTNNVESVIRAFDNNFYLVGTIWDGDDQIERFFKDQIWETGYEEQFQSLINNISKGTILIIKSSFQARGISYLRIKGIGIVTDNFNNGTSLLVDWKIKNIQIDIENLGYYRNTIQEPSIDDVITIFSNIDEDLWYPLFHLPSLRDKRKDNIASLLSDSDAGTDYLDISKDINAFAKVMTAKNFTPPLAVALFGKWGSGKSFFMRKLKDRINELTGIKSHKFYCSGVAQIHFNAWSYMDANLWASIVTRIFEGLNEYIKENTSSDKQKQKVEEQLSKQLNVAKEQITLLETQKEVVTQNLQKLESKKNSLNSKIDRQIENIKNHTLWNVLEAVEEQFHAKDRITKALNENGSFKHTVEELKHIVPEGYWDNPSSAYKQAKSVYTFLKEFFKKEKVGANIFWTVLIIVIIATVPTIIWGIVYSTSKMNFALPQGLLSVMVLGAAAFKRMANTYEKIQPVVASFWQVKMSYEKQIGEATAKFEQEEKALKMEIEKNRTELFSVEKQIQETKIIKAELDFKLTQALSTEALYSFIERRSNSEEYKKHLGIISLIRKDFEILNDLFTDHTSEYTKVKDAEEFKKYFKKPLERIVLYIDDLDRCPEDTVVQVLEAVNLLMAFPLFIVVVGVDPRWVKNALVKRHYLQFAGKINDYDGSDIERIEPSNYLEKIFQIPFCLKDAGDDSVKNMIRKLAEADIAPTRGTGGAVQNANNAAQPAAAQQSVKTNAQIVSGQQIHQTASGQQISTDEIVDDSPETIKLTEKEVRLLEDMSVIVGTNPRAIKRLVNTYRIVKAHDDFNYDADIDEADVLVAMFLLALPIGKYRKLYPSFEKYINDDNNQWYKLSAYLQVSFKIDDLLDANKNELHAALSVKGSYHTLELTESNSFKTHNRFIKRFTFNN